MRRICPAIIVIYVVACVASLSLIPMNAAGMFGMAPDPLSGIYALLLASPWIYLLDGLFGNGDVARNMALAVASMAINIGLLGLLCRQFGHHRQVAD